MQPILRKVTICPWPIFASLSKIEDNCTTKLDLKNKFPHPKHLESEEMSRANFCATLEVNPSRTRRDRARKVQKLG